MRREDDQHLWDLLATGPEPRLSDFFARDVVRRIRQEPRRFEWARSGLRMRRLVPASALAVAVATALIIAGRHWELPSVATSPSVATDGEPAAVAKIDLQDYDVVADLDELLAADKNSLWDENQTL
jgi:hypothetical protein